MKAAWCDRSPSPLKSAISRLSNVPTFQEAGYPEVDPRGWVGLFAPAGLAPDLAMKIEAEVLTILKNPEFQKSQFENITYLVPSDSSSKIFAEFIRHDFDFKQRLIETAKVKF